MGEAKARQTVAWWAGIVLVTLGSLGSIAASSELVPRGAYLPVVVAQIVGAGLLLFEVIRKRRQLRDGYRVGVVLLAVAAALAFGLGMFFALV